MGSRGREEGLEFEKHEAGVVVDVSADGEDGDSAVGGPEGFHVWTREVGGLEALCVWYVAEIEIPYYSLSIGRESIVV